MLNVLSNIYTTGMTFIINQYTASVKTTYYMFKYAAPVKTTYYMFKYAAPVKTTYYMFKYAAPVKTTHYMFKLTYSISFIGGCLYPPALAQAIPAYVWDQTYVPHLFPHTN